MKKIKKLVVMLGLIAVLVFAVQGTSSAAPILEMLDCSSDFVCDVGDIEFETVYLNQADVVGPFEDLYTFTLAADSNFSGAASNYPFLSLLDINGLEISIFADGSSVALASSIDGVPLEIILLAGDYSMAVVGAGVGSAGGSYTASLAITAVPIPPAVLLLGSGILGLVAVARRKRSVAASNTTLTTA